MEFIKNIINTVCFFGNCPVQQNLLCLKKEIAKILAKNIKKDQDQIKIDDKMGDKNLEIQLINIGLQAPWIKMQSNKKILLLDLDKTLIYFCPKNGVLFRPYLNKFVKQLKKFYNIYIFSAAPKKYVTKMLHILKQKKTQFKQIKGALSRQNCIKITKKNNKNLYVKDLKVLTKCNPSQIVIVDDNPISYCLNKQNAVSIAPFQGEVNDQELSLVLDLLKRVAEYQDVRQCISTLSQKQQRYIQNTQQIGNF